ncbi:MAG: hemolysin family protein [Verrucomicrobiota bacterium]
MLILANHFIELSTMALLLLCSAFFSGTETALFSLTREQVKRLRGQGHDVEKTLALLAENPSGLLIAILFGNIVVNILFFSLSVVVAIAFGRHYGEWWEVAVGMAVLLLVILVGEIFPKAIGISFPERVVRLNSLPLRGWFHFLGPVRRVLEIITSRLEPGEQHDNRLNADELKMLIDATRHDPTFGRQEKAIVEDIVNLPEIRVRELMVPRVRQLFRRTDVPAGEALQVAAELEMELIPVYEEEEDNIVGVVEVGELFANDNPDRPLRDFVRSVRFVPETKRADEMLREFLAEGLRMVCVVDEYGGLAGTICLEDLLEEVVGEFDAMEASPVEQLGESTYRLQGSLGIREWRSLFIGFLPDEVVRTLALDTVSGLVVSLLKRMPKVGDVAEVRNLRFTVEEVRSNRIESVLLELSANGEEGAA